MTSRAMLGGALLLLAIATAGGCGGHREQATAPNIVLYVVDTLRADSVTPYGNTVVDTPALESLAANGVLFENAYAQSSWTRASMASLLTSLDPEVHGAVGRADVLPESATLLSEHLREHGYYTGLVNTNPNAGSFFGFAQGFDDVVELYARREPGRVRVTELAADGEQVAQVVTDWMADAPEPFFLTVLSLDPHSPYQAPAQFDRYGGSYAGPADGSQQFITRNDLTVADRKRVRSLYLAEVAYSDRALATTLEFLDENGLARRTIFAFTSDHGEEFWEHGRRGHSWSLFEESIHIPLIFRYPGRVPAGERVTLPVESIDVFPTLLNLAGIPLPAGIAGRPLFPLDELGPAPVYSSHERQTSHLVSLRSGKWKLIWDRNSEQRFLFDLELDPGETRDLARDEPDRLREISDLVRERRRAGEARAIALGFEADTKRASPKRLADDQRRLLEELGYTEEPRVSEE